MSVASAVSTLAAKRMTGVLTYFGPADLPNRLAPSDLPCLILIYDSSFESSLAIDDVSTESYRYRLGFRHLLLLQFLNQGVKSERFNDFAVHLDNYRAMLDDDALLGGHLARPLASPFMQVGVQDWEGELFTGVNFGLALYVG